MNTNMHAALKKIPQSTLLYIKNKKYILFMSKISEIEMLQMLQTLDLIV